MVSLGSKYLVYAFHIFKSQFDPHENSFNSYPANLVLFDFMT